MAGGGGGRKLCCNFSTGNPGWEREACRAHGKALGVAALLPQPLGAHRHHHQGPPGEGEKDGGEGEASEQWILLRSHIRAIVGHITKTTLGETLVSGIRSQISFSGDTQQECILISGINHKMMESQIRR